MLRRPGDELTAVGEFAARGTALKVEGGRTFHAGDFAFRPGVGVSWHAMSFPAFVGTEGGPARLSVKADSYSATRAELGVTVYRSADTEATGVLRLHIGYTRNLSAMEPVYTAAFAELPGAPFTIHGASAGTGAWVFGAALAGARDDGFSYEVSYDAELWNNSLVQMFKGRISYSF